MSDLQKSVIWRNRRINNNHIGFGKIFFSVPAQMQLNIINAVQTAREKGLLSVGLLGGDGGKLAGMVERPLVIPHRSTQRIQEEHIFIIHILVEMVESDLI